MLSDDFCGLPMLPLTCGGSKPTKSRQKLADPSTAIGSVAGCHGALPGEHTKRVLVWIMRRGRKLTDVSYKLLRVAGALKRYVQRTLYFIPVPIAPGRSAPQYQKLQRFNHDKGEMVTNPEDKVAGFTKITRVARLSMSTQIYLILPPPLSGQRMYAYDTTAVVTAHAYTNGR